MQQLQQRTSGLLILYGSQTGNAEDVAERIAREAKRRHFVPVVHALDACDLRSIPEQRFVVFVVSTTGQGEVPHNMRGFWRFLMRKSLPSTLLCKSWSAVFGLGDSGYPKYNVVAKKLERRLEGLGSHLIVKRGLGDDQHPSGYEAALDPWLSELWRALRTHAPLPPGIADPDPADTRTSLEPKYMVEWLVEPATAPASMLPAPCSTSLALTDAVRAACALRRFEAQLAGIADGPPADGQPSNGSQLGPPRRTNLHGPDAPFLAPVLANSRITAPDHFQDTRHIALGLAGSGLSYEPGDLLVVHPQQDAQALQRFMQRLDLDPAATVRIRAAGADTGAPAVQATVGALVAGVVDVAGASPRRFLFQVLACYAGAPLEAERLAYFASGEGRDDLHRYNQRERVPLSRCGSTPCWQHYNSGSNSCPWGKNLAGRGEDNPAEQTARALGPGRTLLEVLEDFPSALPPLKWLLQAAPRLKPRQFSIASSLRMHPGEAHLTVAVVDFRTPTRRRRHGVCTSWLAGLPPSNDPRVPVWIERGVLRMPASLEVPLIMVGPGTGVAPFRAFLEERRALQATGLKPAACTLFFGCRNEGKDFYYRKDWQSCLDCGALSSSGGLVTAFSRDQPQKVYVTHRIGEHGASVWKLLSQGAVIYVSGAAEKMPQGVHEALVKLVEQHGGLSQQEALEYLKQLELKHRYVVEAWS